jgi:hypothetical protein
MKFIDAARRRTTIDRAGGRVAAAGGFSVAHAVPAFALDMGA